MPGRSPAEPPRGRSSRIALITLPAPLVPPAEAEGPEHERHVARLKKRLARNPNVVGAPAEIVEIEAALQQLAVQAARLLSGIAREGAASFAPAIWAKPRKYFSDIIGSAGNRVTAISDAAFAKTTAAWSTISRRGPRPEGDPSGS